MNPLKSLVSIFKSRDKPQNRIGSGFNFLFGSTSSGKSVNETTAMQTTAVYACVRILAEAIAELPLHIYQYVENGGKERFVEHSLYYLLHDSPNDEMTSFVWRETLMSHLLLWGNAFSQIIRDGRGRVLALYPLLPNRVTVDRDKNGQIFYTYKPDYCDGREIRGDIILRKDEVLHIPGLGFDGLLGYSPIAMAKNAVGMAIATEEFGAAFFQNGANPGGVLEHPGTINDIQRIKDNWNDTYRGSTNAHKVCILEEGMSYKQISIPPEQAQFLQTRKFQIDEIARVFRVPPHMVGDLEKSSFSNIEQQSLEFVRYTLNPWVVRWEQAINQSLLLPSERGKMFAKFNLDGLLRGDYESRMRGYSVGIQNGFYSPNDVRTLEQMNTISNGDTYMVNGNMKSLESLQSGGNENEVKLSAIKSILGLE